MGSAGSTVEEGALVDATATLGLGAVVGKNAKVMSGASLGVGVTVGEGASVGAGAILELGVKVMANASVGSGVRLGVGTEIGGEAVVGDGARLGMGVICESGSCVGSNTTLGLGVRILEGAVVAAGSSVPPGKRIAAELVHDGVKPDAHNEPAAEPVAAAAAPVVAKPSAKPPHFGPEALLKSVASGAIAPLRGSWLVELGSQGGRLSRRQDLPEEAFFGIEELRRLVEALGEDYGLLFVALSYRWLTKDHPDPDGFHLHIVAAVARLYMHTESRKSPLTAAFMKKGLGYPDFALFCAPLTP